MRRHSRFTRVEPRWPNQRPRYLRNRDSLWKVLEEVRAWYRGDRYRQDASRDHPEVPEIVREWESLSQREQLTLLLASAFRREAVAAVLGLHPSTVRRDVVRLRYHFEALEHDPDDLAEDEGEGEVLGGLPDTGAATIASRPNAAILPFPGRQDRRT